MTVTVTQEHIDKGKCGRCTICPLALALKDLGLKAVSVRPDAVRINGKLIQHEYRSFVESFDRGLPVEPFSFELDYIPEASA